MNPLWLMGRIFTKTCAEYGLLLLLGLAVPVALHAQHVDLCVERLTQEHGLSNNVVISIGQDQQGFMWFGTHDGLNKYDGYQITIYRHDPADSTLLSASWVESLYVDGQGALWVGTYGGGLDRFDPTTETFTHYRHDPDDPGSLSSDVIFSIRGDNAGNLWMGAAGGVLNKLDRQTGRFTQYALGPVDPNNHIEVIHENSDVDRLDLSYEDKVVAFTFAALDYAAPEKNQYAYRLQGFNDTWVAVGTKRDVTFTTLDPGNYVLQVRGSNNSGVWNETGTSIRLQVQPPFWATWWFRILMLAGGVGLLMMVYQTRTHSIRARNRALQAEVTERKRAEEAVKASEERLRLALDAARMGTWNWNMLTNQITWSEHVEGIFGLEPGAFAGTYEAYLDLLPPDDLEVVKNQIAEALAGGQAYKVEHRIRWPDGGFRWLEGRGQVYRNADGQPVRMAGTVADITERKRAGEALQESEQRHRDLYNNTPVMLQSIDRTGCLLSVSDFWLDTLGYQRSEVLGRPATDFLTEASCRYAREATLLAFFESGVARDIPYQFVKRNGEVIDVLLSAIAEQDEAGEIVRSLAVIVDVTERKRVEEEREALIADLEQRNAEMERFTYTVSHDLKTPLVTIGSFVSLLQQDVAHGHHERIEKDVRHILEATQTMRRLLDDLLELSRIGRVANPAEVISLEDLVREAVALADGQIQKRGVRVVIARSLPEVYGDRLRLLEVFQNLIDNAVKFMGDQPAPCVEIGARQEGEAVVCYVQDNGVGIKPRYHEKVFGLFNRLDQQIDGTGVGLALVKRIVEVHEGKVWVESEGEGHGTTFFFTLPLPSAFIHKAS